MLPSMPVLFSRESQDAFGNKIEPSTSFFSQNSAPILVINPEPPPERPPDPPQLEVKAKKEPEKKKTDPPMVDIAVEDALVRSYYTRVQQRFSSNPMVPTNKFLQFQTILRDFDPSKETPIELYKKIEQLFGPEHKDMVEDFLLFLRPGQAAQVGRFMDRYSLVQMTGFIDLLHKTFARKPTVLRKVVRALTTGLNSGNTAEAKSRVLPHFRAHPRLTALFKSLFPDERPPESAYESGSEVLNESFLTNDPGCEEWEFPEEPDATNKRKLDASDHLDTVYLNGRVFLQHGRLLRSARVTFPYSKEPYRVHVRRLASAQSHVSPPDSEEETQKKKPPQKRPRKQTKSPTKKDVNDNTRNKDGIMSPKCKKPQKHKNGKKDEVAPIKKERKDSKTSAAKKEPVEVNKLIELKAKKEPVEVNKLIELKTNQPKIEPAENATVKETLEVTKVRQPKIDATPIDLKLKLETSKVKQLRTEAAPVVTKVKPEVLKTDKPQKIEATVNVETKKIENINSWTRDEDKTMLQVLKVEAGSEKVFGRIRELLPHRSEKEIKDRFCHVMTLLQQMAVGEVT